MNRYYKPLREDLKPDLLIEFYTKEYWKPILVKKLTRSVLDLAYSESNIRVKYLDSFDFNTLGYIVEKVFLGTQTQIKDILPDGTEITKEIDVFNEELLIILYKGIPVGKFMPWLPENNIEYKGKDYSIKNLTELRKILK